MSEHQTSSSVASSASRPSVSGPASHLHPDVGEGQAETLLTKAKVLQRLGMGDTAFRDRVRAGKAPKPVRVGRRTLWVESEIQAYIQRLIREGRG